MNFMQNYEPALTTDEMKTLGTNDPRELDFNVILVVPENPRHMTANLLGPIIINTSKKIGIQAIMRDNRYTARHPVCQPVSAAGSKGGEKNAYS